MTKMELWNAVCKTDPDHTKHVGTRGGFTAIDAMYQIQCATEQFGAAGEGWGWNFTDPIYPPNGTVVIKCVLWHGTKEQTVEQFGQKKLGDSNRPDEDALKKAGTDALTKCLSYLGFNADVFLGKFDDSKYVDDLRTEQSNKEREAATKKAKRNKAIAFTDMYMKELDSCQDQRDLNNLNTNLEGKFTYEAMVNGLKANQTDLYKKIAEATAKKVGSFGGTTSPSGL